MTVCFLLAAGLVLDGFVHSHPMLLLCDAESLQEDLHTVFASCWGGLPLVRAFILLQIKVYLYVEPPAFCSSNSTGGFEACQNETLQQLALCFNYLVPSICTKSTRCPVLINELQTPGTYNSMYNTSTNIQPVMRNEASILQKSVGHIQSNTK